MNYQVNSSTKPNPPPKFALSEKEAWRAVSPPSASSTRYFREPRLSGEPVMCDELREEIARAIASTSLAHADDAVEPGYPFNRFVDAVLPIIARVRDEARAAERQSIVHYLRQYGACMADGDTFADEIERKWDMLK